MILLSIRVINYGWWIVRICDGLDAFDREKGWVVRFWIEFSQKI